MSSLGVVGVRPTAEAAWLALLAALTKADDAGRSVVCRTDPETWSSDARAAQRREAVEACSHCPVRRECGAFALANEEKHHVWGGHDHTPPPYRPKTERTSR